MTLHVSTPDDVVAQFWETLAWLISPEVVEGYLPFAGFLLFFFGLLFLVGLSVLAIEMFSRYMQRKIRRGGAHPLNGM